VGIEGIKPTRRLEVMPYGAADSRLLSGVHPDDPFNNRVNFAGRAGADVKMGLGPNITLDGTVNPDFGQVEADPAFVNLTGSSSSSMSGGRSSPRAISCYAAAARLTSTHAASARGRRAMPAGTSWIAPRMPRSWCGQSDRASGQRDVAGARSRR